MTASAFGWFWNPTGHWVIFWSGFGSCLTEFAIIGVVWHKINCGVSGCWRVGRHRVSGTDHVVCRKHHPDGGVSAQQVLDDHLAARVVRANVGNLDIPS